MATFETRHTARKRHVPGCTACLRAIEPGEQYARFSATPHDDMWNGDTWAHMKAHTPYGSCLQRDHPNP
ncbi:hypothetical protein [Streptosporangium sp. NPDC002607]